MFDPKYAIFPGIIVASVMLIFLTKIGSAPVMVEAATEQPVNLAVQNEPVQEETSSVDCGLPDRIMDSVRQWCEQIESVAEKYDVEASLIAAVMMQESGGQPEVISASGAVGLMQVMPSDGVASSFMCANGPCFAARPSTSELLDPAFNLDYGVRMIAGLTQKYGDIRDALRSYGPYNVGYYYADKVLAIQAGF
jgi:hypothetical protein